MQQCPHQLLAWIVFSFVLCLPTQSASIVVRSSLAKIFHLPFISLVEFTSFFSCSTSLAMLLVTPCSFLVLRHLNSFLNVQLLFLSCIAWTLVECFPTTFVLHHSTFHFGMPSPCNIFVLNFLFYNIFFSRFGDIFVLFCIL